MFHGDDLQTAIIISLFTDRLANPEDEHQGERRGWWGDKDIGSRLWLLKRKKLTTDTARKAEQYAKEALYWLVDEGVVKHIHIETTIRKPNRLYLSITYTRPDQDSSELLQFYWVWEPLNAI